MTGKDPPSHTPRCRSLPPAAGKNGKRLSANHWKRWDAKPEAVARNMPRYARSVAWCYQQTAGNGGTQSQRLRRKGATLDRLHAGKPLETAGRKTRG